MEILFILVFITSFVNADQEEEFVIKYLTEYGYLQNDTAFQTEKTSALSNALSLFQEYYNLTVDGTINAETLQIISTPRCGLPDNVNNFNINQEKHDKKHLKWHYVYANSEVIQLTKEAFQLWENQSGLTFEHNRLDPDIVIINRKLRHTYYKAQGTCIYQLDGPGNTLAHAFFPRKNVVTEIHIDQDEPWSTKKNGERDKLKLFNVLVHEIGHALGLHHIMEENSVMYPLYNHNWSQHLSREDVLNIQNLYGTKESVATTLPTTSTPKVPVMSPVPEAKPPVLCDQNFLKNFVIIDRKMYIFHYKWVWPIQLSEEQKILKPILLTDLLRFLPTTVRKISHVYRRPNGKIVFVANNNVYMITYPDMNLEPGYPKQFSDVFGGIAKSGIINGIVNTYIGKTYILHDNLYYTEINECDFSKSKQGFISDLFPGVPPGVQSAFRYNNGYLYFIKKDQFYEFNEFTKTLIRSGTFKLSIFNITCPKANILEQLYELLQQLRARYIGSITSSSAMDEAEDDEIYEN